MMTNPLRTKADWECWFAEQTALLEKNPGEVHYTKAVPIRVPDAGKMLYTPPVPLRVSAKDAGPLQYSKPFPLRRRRGR